MLLKQLKNSTALFTLSTTEKSFHRGDCVNFSSHAVESFRSFLVESVSSEFLAESLGFCLRQFPFPYSRNFLASILKKSLIRAKSLDDVENVALTGHVF